MAALGLDGAQKTIIPGLLWFEVIKNPGAAFGLFQALGPFLIIATLIMMYAGYKIARHEEDTVLISSLSLILGGAAGNLIDRLFRGGVIDFVRIPYWALFNIADSAITIGAIGILYYGFIKRRGDQLRDNAPGSV